MDLFWTVIIAFAFFLLAIILISSGLLLVGRSRIRGGSCSRLPSKNKEEGCGTDRTCDLCSPGKEKKDNDTDIRQK